VGSDTPGDVGRIGSIEGGGGDAGRGGRACEGGGEAERGDDGSACDRVSTGPQVHTYTHTPLASPSPAPTAYSYRRQELLAIRHLAD
jgi:hypothetical protein